MTNTVIVNTFDVELDNGENLRALGTGGHLELDHPTAGMAPGVWRLTAYRGQHEERAEMQRLTAAEVNALRHADAAARMYE